jgi:hypothetical protein
MIRRIILIIFSICLLIPSAALSEHWELIFEQDNNKYFFAPSQMIHSSDGKIKVWVKTLYFPPIDNLLTHEEIYVEYDCKEGKFRNLKTTFYLANEKVETDSEKTEWIPAVPDTADNKRLKMLCEMPRH